MLRNHLIEWLGVEDLQTYDVDGTAGSRRPVPDRLGTKDRPGPALAQLDAGPPDSDSGSVPVNGEGTPDLFATMRAGDVLVHYPYQSFTSSVERFVRAGGRRPQRARDQDDRVPHLR